MVTVKVSEINRTYISLEQGLEEFIQNLIDRGVSFDQIKVTSRTRSNPKRLSYTIIWLEPDNSPYRS